MASAKRGPKRKEDFPDPVLRRMFQVMPRWESQHDICQELQIDESSFSKARVAGRPISVAILERVAWRSGCRVQWLRTGEGDIYEEGARVQALPDALQDTIQVMQWASGEARKLLERAARLLATNQVPVMEAIENGVIAAKVKKRIAEDLNARVPDDLPEEPTN